MKSIILENSDGNSIATSAGTFWWLILIGYKAKYNLMIPVKSHAFSVRVTLLGIQSRSHAHPHYHANTKLDEFENFSEDNKTA